MKTTFSNKELVHIWANQKQESGKGSSMFFNGPAIYSYGYHFMIAKIVNGVTLFTTQGYSNTTAKHKSYTLRAINNKMFSVPYVDLKGSKSLDKEYHKKNVQYYVEQIKSCLDKATTSRTMSQWLISQAHYYQGCARDYCQTFKIKPIKVIREELIIPYELLERAKGQEQKANALREKQDQEKRIRLSEIYNLVLGSWLSGGPYSNEHGSVYEIPESYLRVKDSQIETSHGAKVSLEVAKRLFDRIQAKENVVGFNVDGYTVLSLNGFLKVGCHKIELTEIQRFAKTQNWI